VDGILAEAGRLGARVIVVGARPYLWLKGAPDGVFRVRVHA
jgi:hypothetical protein